MMPEFGRTQYLSYIRYGRWNREGAVVLFRRSCFHLRHKMSAQAEDGKMKELRTLKATGALFGFSSFRVSVTSWLKGPIQEVKSANMVQVAQGLSNTDA